MKLNNVSLRPVSSKTWIVVVSTVFFFSLLMRHFGNGVHNHNRAAFQTASSDTSAIPNIAHFVWLLADPKSNFTFEFKHFLSIYATATYWQPDQLIIHTNAGLSAVEYAREGHVGKWNERILNIPGLKVNRVPMPTHAGNGMEITYLEHKSDFVRVQVVKEMGGVYIDWDIHPLRDIRQLRESGFKSVVGEELWHGINCGIFMSIPSSKLLRIWWKAMNAVYDGGWTTHSNIALAQISRRLVRQPGESLIMERDAFAPWSWDGPDEHLLYDLHNDEPSNLEGIKQGDRLPSFTPESYDDWEGPADDVAWPRDWSATYVIHAFGLHHSHEVIEGFDEITPRYILERRSNLARALYPIAKHMYDEGLIEIDDYYSSAM